MPPLNLAVDARDLARDYRGIGRYARAVLRRLLPRDDVSLTLLVNGPFAFRRRAELSDALGAGNFQLAGRVPVDADVVWHPANGTFFSSQKPSVVTLHDVAPFRFPDPDARERHHQQAPFLRSARTLTSAIAVSEFGREELHNALDVPPERTTVIYHGVEPAFQPAERTATSQRIVSADYLLFVGDAGEARKNFPMFYDAYRRAWPELEGPRLAVAGPEVPDLPGVVALGRLSDEAIVALYRDAIALTLPAYYEAFGMPMIEAMACGTPVVASQASCLPEIGGDAALYAAPDDPSDWARALHAVTRDDNLRERLHNAGLARASTFNWDRSAEAHLAVFQAARYLPKSSAAVAPASGASSHVT